MWFPRLEMRCLPARSLVGWGDQKAFTARPHHVRRKRVLRGRRWLVPFEAMAGKRASPLGLRGARLPRSGAVGSPLALRAAASPQHSIYRIPARLRLPRDESRVGGQGSRAKPRARRPESTVAHGVSTGSQQRYPEPPEVRARSKR